VWWAGVCLVDRIDPMRAGSGSVYLWLEKSCPPKRRDLALEIAVQYLRARNARYLRHSTYTLIKALGT
jgi:hypothetical protein